MSVKFIRIYQELDIQEIKGHLLIYGDLSGNCGQCQAVDIPLDQTHCPACQTDFRFLAFRNIRSHLPKMQRIKHERPYLTFVDYEDYSRMIGALKARELLG